MSPQHKIIGFFSVKCIFSLCQSCCGLCFIAERENQKGWKGGSLGIKTKGNYSDSLKSCKQSFILPLIDKYSCIKSGSSFAICFRYHTIAAEVIILVVKLILMSTLEKQKAEDCHVYSLACSARSPQHNVPVLYPHCLILLISV